MTERVDDVTIPVAEKLVLRGPLQLCAALHRPRDNVVDVLDVDKKESRGAGKAASWRRFGPPLRGLLLDNDDRITDLDLSVGDRAVRLGKRIRSVAANTSA
jgi:hypothetical protein